MAFNTRRSGRALLVPVVAGSAEDLGLMATEAQGVTIGIKSAAMRIMAIRTDDALRVHPALKKGPIFVDLVKNLPVRMVKILPEDTRVVGVEKGLPGNIVLTEQRPS
jgi:hypothetical protein